MALHIRTYIFEHPTDNKIASITRRSYIYAGLLGAFYVLASGFVGQFFLALAVDALFVAVGLLAAIGIIANMPSHEASVVLVFLVIVVMAVRARPMIALVRTGYQNAGWSVTPI